MKDNKLEKPKPIRKIPNKKITPKPPRPNIMWFYVVIVIVLLVVATMMNTSTNPPISYQRFEQMLKQHDVQKVATYKSGDLFIAEVFLKPDALSRKSDEYRDAKREKSQFSFSDEPIPQYVFTSSTYDWLFKQINDAETSWGWPESEKIP